MDMHTDRQRHIERYLILEGGHIYRQNDRQRYIYMYMDMCTSTDINRQSSVD